MKRTAVTQRNKLASPLQAYNFIVILLKRNRQQVTSNLHVYLSKQEELSTLVRKEGYMEIFFQHFWKLPSSKFRVRQVFSPTAKMMHP